MYVTSDESHFRNLAPGQRNCKETFQIQRAVVYTVSNLTDPRMEPQTYIADIKVLKLLRQPVGREWLKNTTH